MRRVAVLGATGSIGASALDVIARHPDRLQASVLAAGRNVDALLELCARHAPAHAVIADEARFDALKSGLAAAGAIWLAPAVFLGEAGRRMLGAIVENGRGLWLRRR